MEHVDMVRVRKLVEALELGDEIEYSAREALCDMGPEIAKTLVATVDRIAEVLSEVSGQ